MDRDAMQRVIDEVERRAAMSEPADEVEQDAADEPVDGLPTTPRALADLILGR